MAKSGQNGHLKKGRKPPDSPPAWYIAFIDALLKHRSVTKACLAIGRSRSGVYVHRKKDPDFAAAWDEAVEINVDDLEGGSLKRAIDGWSEPVFYNGKICGHKQRYSDALTIFFLKYLRPEKYGDKALLAYFDAKMERVIAVFTAAIERVIKDPDTRAKLAQEIERGYRSVLIEDTEANERATV